MKRKIVRLTENDLHRIVRNSVKRIMKESFEDDYNSARDRHVSRGGMFGIELKNPEGKWEYGTVDYDPNTQQMSCMGVSIAHSAQREPPVALNKEPPVAL